MSRVSVRGTLTDAHNEITRTQVEVLDSTLWSYMCAVVDNRSLEDGDGVERIDQGSSASHRRIRKRARASRWRRAQGRHPPPDARTRARAFNAPDASPPNTLVTGSVIGNRHPSRRSFLQPSPPNDPGRVRARETGMERLIRTPSRQPRSALRISGHCTASDPRPNTVPSWG